MVVHYVWTSRVVPHSYGATTLTARAMQGQVKVQQGRQVLQDKIFARTKKKTTIATATKSTLPSIPGPRHRVQVDVDTNSGSRAREGPFLPHLPRPNRSSRQSPNEFELHSIVEILNLKKKELHSLPEQKPDMVMTRSHRSPPGKNMRIPKDLPMTIKSYRDGEGADGTVLRPPRQIVVVVPSVALESPRKTVKQTQLVMVDNKADEKAPALPPQNETFGRLTGKYLTRRPSQEHRAGHFNNFRQYLKRSKSRKAAPFAPAPSASTQDRKILNVSGSKNIPTLPVIPSIRSDDEIKTVMSENGVVLNGDFPANLSGVSSEDTSSSIRSELGKVFSNSSSSKSSADTNNNNSNAIRVKRLANPQQKMRRAKDQQGRDSGNESSDSLDGLKDGSTTEERSRPRWSPGQKRYVVDKSHIHQQMASKNGYSVAKRYFDRQDREKHRSGLPSVLQSDQDYLTRTINGNPNKGKSGNHIVYVEKTHSIRRRRESGESTTETQMRYRDPPRILGQVAGHRNPPPSPVDTNFKVKSKRQADYNRPDSGIATRNSDSTGLSNRTDSSGVHSEVRRQPVMKTPAIWDETFTMRVTEDETPSSDSDTESMPKPITMISINQSEQQVPNNSHTTSETTELYRGGYGRAHQDIDNRSLLSVPDTESLRANTPMPKALNDADDTESTSTISVPKITMTCATPLPPRATPSTTPPPSDGGLRLFVSDIERVGGVVNR
ncbi:Hypp3330 [Branchiostoma lanceolatum]|uniref:Hypp3330 protein n=1 Tax=Branchiostoma lanceolatum TaxID=7740 RepID=A0A8K0A1F4_BRALA|nr:Hypp3330 [Branchiostoma lanceolatum]